MEYRVLSFSYLGGLSSWSPWTRHAISLLSCRWGRFYSKVFFEDTIERLIQFILSYYLVDKVGCLDGPAIGDLVSLDIDLSGQNLLSDLSTTLPYIGAAPIHTFVSYHTNSEIVGSDTMILSAHDFRGHVAGCAWGLTRIVRRPIPRDTEVSQPQIPVLLKHQVLRLYISVYNSSTVYDFECLNKTGDKEFGLILLKLALSCYMIAQIASQQEIHHQIQVLSILKSVVHIHNKTIQTKSVVWMDGWKNDWREREVKGRVELTWNGPGRAVWARSSLIGRFFWPWRVLWTFLSSRRSRFYPSCGPHARLFQNRHDQLDTRTQIDSFE